ncbi:AMP-binding protein [Streptomyces pratensis]|uniref:AMP-binding protein n=1 Tax=Streptomyces pratensis TaxID=1169025 RepID=UPI0019330FCC|nr:AMP-binding protein [Streptomyces pratensis]
MRHDETPDLGPLAEALDDDIRVRRFTIGEPGADGASFFDVELERDEPAIELRRRLAQLVPGVEVSELPGTDLAPGQVSGTRSAALPEREEREERAGPPVRRQTGIIALSGPPPEVADGPRDRLVTLGHTLTRAAEGGRGITVIDSDGSELRFSWAELSDLSLVLGDRLREAAGGHTARVLLATVEPSATLLGFWSCVMADLDPILVPAELLTSKPADIEAWVTRLRDEYGFSLIVTHRDTAEFDGSVWEQFADHGIPVVRADASAARAEERPAGTAARRASWDGSHPLTGDPERTVSFMTSGSTGRPKVIAQRHAALLSVAAGSSWMNGLGAHDVGLNWMPLSHVGGIMMNLVRDAYIGAEHITVAPGRILSDPQEWFRLVDAHRVTATWSPNFALKLLSRTAGVLDGGSSYDLSSLRFYLNGGEAVSVRDVREFEDRLALFGLRRGIVAPAWGMTETCSGVAYNTCLDTRTAAPGVPSVGFPVPGAEIRIVPLEEQSADGPMIGRVEVRGPSVLERYAVGAGAADPDAEGWFRTGDLGWIADDGLHISGRDEGRLIINGVNWNAADIETAVEGAPGVAPGTGVAVGHRSRTSGTEEPVVFCAAAEGADPAGLPGAVRTHLLAELRLGVRRVIVVEPSDIERTGIGKVRKKQLVERFVQEDAGTRTAAETGATTAEEVPAGSVRGSRVVWQRETADGPADRAAGVPPVPLGPGTPLVVPTDGRAGVVLHGAGLGAGTLLDGPEDLLAACARWAPWLDELGARLSRTAPVTVLVRERAEGTGPAAISHPLAAWIRAYLAERGRANVRTLWADPRAGHDAVRATAGRSDLSDRYLDGRGTTWTRALVPVTLRTAPAGPAHHVLIGGTGRLGTALAARLTRAGHRVTVAGRTATGGAGIACDISTEEGRSALVRALTGDGTGGGTPVHLVHLAGSPDVGDRVPPPDVVRPKTDGLDNTFAAARELGATVTVLSSVNAHLGGAGVPYYAAACAAAEARAALADVPVGVVSCSRVEGAEHLTGGEDVATLSGIRTVALQDLADVLTACDRPDSLLLGVAARNRYVNEEGACRLRVRIPAPAAHAPAAPEPAPTDAAGDGDGDGDGEDLAGRLLRLTREVLPGLEANPDDNWFDLGMTSVDLPLLAKRIAREEKQEVTLVDMMRYPSITALAGALDGRAPRARSTAGASAAGAPAADGGAR